MNPLRSAAAWVRTVTARREPRCTAALTLAGRKYPCQSTPDHPWAHHNKDVEAIWYGPLKTGNKTGS